MLPPKLAGLDITKYKLFNNFCQVLFIFNIKYNTHFFAIAFFDDKF